MSQNLTLGDRVIRGIQAYRRLERILFPSPAEVAFVRLMRGRAYTVPFIKHSRTGFPLTFLSLGKLLRGELIEREVRIGRMYADFATPRASYRKCIEIDGRQYHDIVYDQEKDDYLAARGWQVLRIPARQIYKKPREVYVATLRFLKR